MSDPERLQKFMARAGVASRRKCEKLIEEDVQISDQTKAVLSEIHAAVLRSVDAAVQSVAQGSEIAAQTVTSMKNEITRLVESAELHEAKRLVAEEPKRLPAYTIEVDLIEKLRRIYYFSKRMAKTVTPRDKLADAAPATTAAAVAPLRRRTK